ncbi:MAG TPA: hypothetical protein VF752_05670 [Thermoleophilaceae bacterium]
MNPHAATGLRALAGIGEVRAALQQKDNLCGPFHAARVLRDAGFDVDQDLIALTAGTVLPDEDPQASVPTGAVSRRDYRVELPLAAEPAVSGTAAADLAQAIEQVSRGELRCVPLRGEWSAETVERLVDGAGDARLIANVRTGHFWGARPPLETLLRHLAGEEVDPPSHEWDVGHFVELVSLVRGAGGSLVVVCDSYPTFGWQAHHLQPPAAVAAALLRGDGREGGVLAVTDAADAARVEQLAAELGLDVETWDNGTRR